MLASLLQQSAELGTSLSQSLRIYSDEMRNKRDAPGPHGLVPDPGPRQKLALEKRITTGSIRTKMRTGKTKRINGTVNLAGSE